MTRVYGILNGTCNYILSTMTDQHRSFGEALKEAQDLGYAEADPTFDIGGFDTAHKLAILTSLAFGTELDFEQVDVEGIQSISEADIEAAEDMGYRIKLLGVATRNRERHRGARASRHGAEGIGDLGSVGRHQRRRHRRRLLRQPAARRPRRRRPRYGIGGRQRHSGHRPRGRDAAACHTDAQA